MLTGPSAIFAALLLIFCLLTAVHSQGGSVGLFFADVDISVVESASDVTPSVRVEGAATENLNVTIIPLTVSQYQADPSRYRNSCDGAIATSIDPAEESDFSGQEVVREIPSTATSQGLGYTFTVNIGIIDDDIRELNDEYFLLFVNGSQSPSVDTITYPDRSRECIRATIQSDQDPFSIRYVKLIDPIEVSEGIGTAEIIRIEKQGQIEEPVDVTFSGAGQDFTISPSMVTLQPSQTSAIVNITVVDNLDAEGDNAFSTISAASDFGNGVFPITIKENDRFLIGFDRREVTVTEGETVTLSTSFSRDVELIPIGKFFVFTQRGSGNATEMIHYTNTTIDPYAKGSAIEIPTIDSRRLERSRQFEVKLAYSVPAPFIDIDPDTVIVTIKDRDGPPGKPNVVSIGREKGNLTVTWTIDSNDLRPVFTFIIKVQTTGSRNQDGEFNMTIDADKANCKLNGTTKYLCMVVTGRKVDDDGKMYDVTVCAKSILGENCSDPTAVPPKPAPLEPEGRLPTGSIVGIVFAVIVGVLACCLLWVLIALIVCCTCWEREKKYNPEKKEKEHEKIRNKDMYTKVDRSESPTNEYDYYV